MKFQWSWTGTTHRKRVQERLCMTVLLFLWIREYSYCLLEQGRSCRLYFTDPVICEFLYWVVMFAKGIVYMFMCEWDTILNPRRTLWTIFAYTCAICTSSKRRSPNFQLSRLLLCVAVTYVQWSPFQSLNLAGSWLSGLNSGTETVASGLYSLSLMSHFLLDMWLTWGSVHFGFNFSNIE